MSVVSLPGRGPLGTPEGAPPVAGVIEALECALEEAKAGQIRAIGLAVVLAGGETSTRFGIAPDEACSHQLVAAITYLQVRYVSHKLAISEHAT